MINHLPRQKNQQIALEQLPASVNQEQQNRRWQAELANAITDIDELLSILALEHIKSSLYLPDDFGLRVPRGFVAKMCRSDADDALLKQVLPSKQEQQQVTGFVRDPLAEQGQNPITGLLHKYRSRVLMTVTGACAIHCRYCFRQHFDYQSNLPSKQQMDDISNYIVAHPEVSEVILSGGDPLSVSNRRLFMWLDKLTAIEQINTIRIHTRLPVVIPERLDDELLAKLTDSRCNIVMVIHCNHANEIDDHTAQYLQAAKDSGITLLNQAVLLAEINDTLTAQVELNQRLFAAGVLPYYLHVLDRVAGAAHFEVDVDKAVSLYWQMLEQLPGYLMPKLVQELPHQPFKTPVDLYSQKSSQH